MPDCLVCPHRPYSDDSDVCRQCRSVANRFTHVLHTEFERAKYEREYADRDERMEDDI